MGKDFFFTFLVYYLNKNSQVFSGFMICLFCKFSFKTYAMGNPQAYRDIWEAIVTQLRNFSYNFKTFNLET